MEGQSTVQLIANCILAVIWIAFYETTLERRFRPGVMAVIWAAAVAVWFPLVCLIPYGTAGRILVGPVIFFVVPLFAYQSRWLRCIFSVGLSMAIMLAVEVLMTVLFPQLRALTAGTAGMGELGVRTQIAMYLLYLPLNALLLMLAALFFRRYRTRLPSREWRLYALFPFSQMLLCLAWFILWLEGDTANTLIWQGLALVVCTAADIALYFAMRGMAQRAALEAEKALLEKQIDAQKGHYAALTAQYESIRHMRHDIENHLHTIHILLENGQNAEAAAYASELQGGNRYHSRLGACLNPVVDAFLFHRAEELRTQDMEVDAAVSLPPDMGVANADLISAFGNLLDNAAEACRSAPSKRISIRARIKNGYLLIETENPAVLPEEKAKPRRIPELERGVGFHILRELAEKYGGEFVTSTGDGVFHAALTLREVTADAAYCGM